MFFSKSWRYLCWWFICNRHDEGVRGKCISLLFNFTQQILFYRFPLKETISALISKYSSDGYLDILTAKWYGSLACFKLDREIGQPKPLGVAAVAGVFLLLGLGMILGLLILIFEHLFYKYTLPILRHQPKNTVWRSRNIMFFSQKLYRFINCVELVSPHHAAKELVHTIRQGQITSLFQKSIKRVSIYFK